MHSPRGFLEQICYFLLCYFLISGPVTASFGFPASKSLWPLKTFKLNLALSNLFYSAARPMHPNWLRITSLFILFHGWFFFAFYWIHISRESHESFFTSLPLRDRSSPNFYFFWLLCLFFALTILMLVRQMNFLKDASRKLIKISFFPEWLVRLHILSVVLILLRSLFRLCEEQPVSAMKQWPVNSGMFETLLVNLLKSNWLTSALVDGVTSTLTILKAT